MIGGLALSALALAYLWGATLIPQSTLSDEVGARGLPFALGALLAFVGAAIAVKAWLARAIAAPNDASDASSTSLPPYSVTDSAPPLRNR